MILTLSTTTSATRTTETIRLTGPQRQIYRAGWTPSARFRTAVCGRRFGKTYLAAKEMRRAVREAIRNGVSPDNEIWYGAPTFKQAKRVFWSRLKRSIPRNWMRVRPNESECSITLQTGHVIRIVGLDNFDALRGSGLWFFLGDEWADCKLEAWVEVIRPMLSTSGGHALFIGTPKGFNHFYDGFIAGQPGGDPDTRSWSFTTVEGGNVPPDELAAARRTLDARTFRQEYEASFETFAGQVYYAFARAHSVKPRAYDAARDLHIGMDFNINPMSATVWQEFPEAGGIIAHQVDEIVIPTSNTDEMADEITRRYGRAGFDPTRPNLGHISIYPDPAGAQRRTSAQGRTDLSILAERGFKVFALTSHPLVRDRINLVNGRFQNADGARRAFVDPRCVKSIEAYERLVYKDGTNEPDKDDGFDHLPDATGYFMFARYSHKPAFRTDLGHMGR